jgi:monofunctional glycosyltransferase
MVRLLLRLMGAAAIGLALYEASVFARVWWWGTHNPTTTAFMEARRAVLAEDRPGMPIRQVWVPYSRISPALKRAVIAAEDARFLDHEGFDWEGIQKALEKNLKRGRIVAGGSTISQQLAKNLFLSGRRTPWRKGEEALITLMLEHEMDKRRILEIYLNVIEWGVGIFGAEAAARHYYGVSAAQLTSEQAARLAAMIPNPNFYDVNRRAPHLARKTGIILSRMESAELP